MESVLQGIGRLFNPPPRMEVALARAQAARLIRAANDLGHHDVLSGLVSNVKGARPPSPPRKKASKAPR